MSDSFSELRHAGGSNRPWVISAVAVLVVTALAALGAAGWALTRPAEERNPIPRVVTVTAQPTAEPGDADSGSLAPGTYSGWLFSSSHSGESGWNVVLAATPESAVLVYPGEGCSTLLSPSDGRWEPTAQGTPCAASDGPWSLTPSAPGVVEAVMTTPDGTRITGSLSRQVNGSL